MFQLAHISDPHGSTALASAQTLASQLANTFCICTGDIVPAYYDQGIGDYDNSIFAPVIGNHDAITKEGAKASGYDWSQQPTQAQLYSRYLAGCPLVDAVQNKTWWTHENIAESVLVIGLNDAINSADLITEEVNWLNAQLDYAKTNGLAVLIAKHGFPLGLTAVDCVMTDAHMVSTLAQVATAYGNAYPHAYKLMDAIAAFDGKLLGVIAGHEHLDWFCTMTRENGEKVPYILIASTLLDADQDIARSETPSACANVVLNLYRYSSQLNALEVYRLGASGSASGDRRKTLVWDYGKQAIVSQVSATEY